MTKYIVINKDLSGGCQGSIPELGFTYTQLFGLVSEADYPYTSGNVSIVQCLEAQFKFFPNLNFPPNQKSPILSKY